MLLAATAIPSLGHLARRPPTLGRKKVLPSRYRDLCASVRHTNKFSHAIRVWFGFEERTFQGYLLTKYAILRTNFLSASAFEVSVYFYVGYFPENSSSSSKK